MVHAWETYPRKGDREVGALAGGICDPSGNGNTLNVAARIGRSQEADLKESTFKIISDHFGYPLSQLQETTSFWEDLRASELDRNELIITIEERFGVTLPEKTINSINTVGDLLNALLESPSKGNRL